MRTSQHQHAFTKTSHPHCRYSMMKGDGARRWQRASAFAQHVARMSRALERSRSLSVPASQPSRHMDYLSILRRGTHLSPMLRELSSGRNAARIVADSRTAAGSCGVVLTVETSEDLDSTPYFMQGAAELSTLDAATARQRLRNHRLVLEALHMWWEAAQRSLQSGGGDIRADALHREGYSLMMTRCEGEQLRDPKPPPCADRTPDPSSGSTKL